MTPSQSLIADLENAVRGSSNARRVETLRRVTDLFFTGADRYTEEQVGLFDDVLGRLIERMEDRALIELSERLATVDNAPRRTIRRLAGHDEIRVAAPVLAQSPRLGAEDLVAIATSASQAHLLAMSGRNSLAACVTDVLVDRGNTEIVHRLSVNEGAQFSDDGYRQMAMKAERNELLLEAVGARQDVPLPVLGLLLSRATEAVRVRLMARVSPEQRERIDSVVKLIADDVTRETARDRTTAYRLVAAAHAAGELDERRMVGYLNAGQPHHVVAALAFLSQSSVELIEQIMRGDHNEPLLIPCRAAGFAWATVQALLKSRPAQHGLVEHEMNGLRADYGKLSEDTARRVLRFWKLREGVSVQVDLGVQNAIRQAQDAD